MAQIAQIGIHHSSVKSVQSVAKIRLIVGRPLQQLVVRKRCPPESEFPLKTLPGAPESAIFIPEARKTARKTLITGGSWGGSGLTGIGMVTAK